MISKYRSKALIVAARTEQVAKYNESLRIEEKLGERSMYRSWKTWRELWNTDNLIRKLY